MILQEGRCVPIGFVYRIGSEKLAYVPSRAGVFLRFFLEKTDIWAEKLYTDDVAPERGNDQSGKLSGYVKPRHENEV